MGIPVVMNVGENYYTEAPVLQGDGPEGLAAQVYRVLEDPLAASAEAKGREWAERFHSPQIAVEKLAQIYRQVLAA
jgi:hypothetical protein